MLAIFLLVGFAYQGPPLDGEVSEDLSSLVRRHCASCHGGERPSAKFDLSDFRVDASEPERVAEMLSRVRSGDMPPPEEVEFSGEERTRLVHGLESALAALVPDPGRPTLRRLNRFEYGNAVRALLEIDLDVERDLPEDASSEGFDNQGDVLFVTPHLTELYLDAAERAIAAFVEERGQRYSSLVEDQDVERLLERAFRRPPTSQEIAARERLLRGDDGVRGCLASVLLSPHFLFRIEEDRDEEEPWRISSWELATRLSFFLWAAPPDDVLLAAARDESLLDPEVLAAQVDRMIDDERSRALGSRFAGRWLGFADVETRAVDFRRFKGVAKRVKTAMVRESTLFFERLVREDRSLLELVDSKSTFLNATLAKHYGIDGVEGNKMRRVELDDRRRGGVLTQASILTVTSQPLRTSPVVRGAWILDRLFGTPSPPPPPDAGSLPPDDQLDDGLTLRQRLEKHREEARCASCHARIDPLGFALENYDGVGRWRDEDHVGPIDASAILPNGREVNGVVGLKDALLEEPERIARGAASAMLVYALGRPLEPADQRVLSEIVLRLREQQWSARTLVHSIVASYPFQFRRAAQ